MWLRFACRVTGDITDLISESDKEYVTHVALFMFWVCV